MTEIKIDKSINLKGLVCPHPWVKANKVLRNMRVGEVLEILVDHAPASVNIPNNFREQGQTVLTVKNIGGLDWQIVVKKEK